MTSPPSSAPAVAGVERNSTLAHYSREALQGQREHIEKLEAQNKQLREALNDLQELFSLPGESSNDSFERIAEAFCRETGWMAPGKDMPAAAGDFASMEARCAAWDAWYASRAAKARAALGEAL